LDLCVKTGFWNTYDDSVCKNCGQDWRRYIDKACWYCLEGIARKNAAFEKHLRCVKISLELNFLMQKYWL